MLQKKFFAVLFVMLFFAGTTVLSTAMSQPRVTFQFDIENELKEGFYDPERHTLKIRSNNYSFSDSGYLTLTQSEKDPTLYTATVSLPRSMVNRNLNYQFVIVSNNRIIKEDFIRYVQIKDSPQKLDVLSFDYFEL